MGKTRRSKKQRREEAEIRATERSSVTPRQQLDKLDRLFGKGKGAQKERVRLKKQLQKKKKVGKTSKTRTKNTSISRKTS